MGLSSDSLEDRPDPLRVGMRRGDTDRFWERCCRSGEPSLRFVSQTRGEADERMPAQVGVGSAGV